MPPFFLFTFRSCALCPCSFPICHSLIFAVGVITLALTCFVSSLFWSSCARWWVVRPLFPVSLAPAPLPPLFVSVLPFGLLFLSPFSLASPGSSFPSGVVPGLSSRRLVQDFQHRPHFPLSLVAALFSYCPPSLSLLPCLTSVPVWYFWP